MNRSLPGQQRGAALLIVLFIVALISILATEMGTRLQLQIQRAQNIKDNNQAHWYALGAEEYAKTAILDIYEIDDGKVSLNQPWVEPLQFPVDGGVIEVELIDAQTCFNVNALAQAPDPTNNLGANTQVSPLQSAFTQLILNVNNNDTYQAETFRDSVIDFLDDNQQTRPFGAEDEVYRAMPNPYITPNRPLVDISELRLVNGVQLNWFADLLEQVCVLPNNQRLQININTLTMVHAPLLAALTTLSLDDAQNLIENRPEEGYDNVGDFLAEPILDTVALTAQQRAWFTISTDYFTLRTTALFNDAQFTMTSLLYVSGQQRADVIQRRFGS
ncbi:MAG: type II secretion system minor pseudopilin GspK [Glaciecola sp.]